jgi:phosphate-selective porin OprO/OprP
MNFNKKLAVAVSGAVLLMAGQVALADSATDIVDALVSKGVLTEEEGKLITKGHTSKTSVTPVVKEKDGAFILESANGRNSIQLTGRIHLDYRQNNLDVYDTDYNDRDSATAADNFELRRARLGVKGKFAKDFKYEIVGNLPGTATVDVAYFDYAKYDAVQLRLGKFKQPFNLEELTSSNNIDFMERSYVNQLAPAKKIGAMLFGQPATGFSYAGSVYAVNDTEQDSKSDKASYAGRATLNFAEVMGNKDMVMHVGLAGFNSEYNITPANSSASGGSTTTGTFLSYRTPGRGLSNIFRAQIGGEVVSATAAGLADPSNATSQVKSKALGLEGILAYNNFKLQGEFTTADFKANSGIHNTTPTAGADEYKLDTQAWYTEAMWLVTGEKYSDSYKAGAFGAIKPKNEFDPDKGNWGAWELGLRYEQYEVDNIKVNTIANGTRAQGSLTCASGGTANTLVALNGCESKSKTYTAGIKWVLNPNALVKLNYSRTKFGNEWEHFDLNDNKLMKHEDIVMMRTQFTF